MRLILATVSGKQRVVGVVSMGAMGAAMTRVLINAGERVVTSAEGRSPRTRTAADQAGATTLDALSDVIAESDVLFSLVPPDAAVDFAHKVAAAMQATKRTPLFIDGNSIAPSTLDLVRSVIQDAGGRVLDLSIIGPPPAVMPRGELATPQFYVAGGDVELLTEYRHHGLDVRVIGATPGAAKALKMCYAGITKGVIAIVVEMLLAGRRMGVSTELMAQMNVTQQGILRQVSRQAEGFAPKSHRWVGEMHEMELTFAALELPTGFFQAAGEIFDRLAATELGRPSDELPDKVDLDMILDTLERRMSHDAGVPGTDGEA
jgi:3-hydroxyisobutyrate dehydrogenase-like beta-hydroxyacid dehydrogenase